MRLTARCRKCGRPMGYTAVDACHGKFSCRCGFTDTKTFPGHQHNPNPFTVQSISPPLQHGASLDQELMERTRQSLSELSEIARLAFSGEALAETLGRVAARVAEQMDVSVCSIYGIADGRVVMLATHGFPEEAVGRVSMALGEGVTGHVARTLAPISLEHACLSPLYRDFAELHEERYHAMLSFPIVDFDGPLGVINVNSTTTQHFSEAEIHFLSIVANLLCVPLKNAGRG